MSYTWTPTIIGHTLLAASALPLGAMLLAGPKGTRVHRIAGWCWVIIMAGVAGVSFFIRTNGWSWIHLLSIFTLFTLVSGVRYARTHQRQAHRGNMIGLYAGALIIAGLFTLLPGRLIGQSLSVWWAGL
jgi:uncharacterized membrane protein